MSADIGRAPVAPATPTRGWRYAAFGGAALGLAAAPHIPPAPISFGVSATLLALALVTLIAVRPSGCRSRRSHWPWLACLALSATSAGALAGNARTAAIDRGAYAGDPGERVSVRGFVAAVPRSQGGIALVPVDTPDGRLVVEAPAPAAELRVGGEVIADGVVRRPQPWQAERLRIAGVSRIVAAGEIATGDHERGGLTGALDRVRDRAEAALERDVPGAEAALARGFVLGQDDRIDAETVDDFRRSGLAHLLAVSGQNVLLLALLAFPLLGLFGLDLRRRLIVVIALIIVYVPITGAGPSIQRAGVMGVAAIVAVLAGRPSLRWYTLLLAAVVTLAVNPRAAEDVGWQLSFAAVIGILVAARPLARLASGSTGRGSPSRLRAALAEGFGVTAAATLATAPISAIHFETLSLASLPANLLALPAVAPVMWLGMLSAAFGQIRWLPVEPLNWISSLLIAYIAQIADWFGEPRSASIDLSLPGPGVALPAGIALAGLVVIALRAHSRRDGMRRSRSLAASAAAVAILAVALLAPLPPAPQAPASTPSTPGLTITLIDVGQGDAILLDPDPGEAVLVDAGPPGTDLAERLADHGVERLAAIVVTHDHSDHVGGLGDVLREVPARVVVHAAAGRGVRALAASTESESVEAGIGFRSGALELRVLAPADSEHTRATDPNERSIVLLARWRRFEALLTGDAEAEAVPIDPGRIDLLKVAHHGSEDAGLPGLLDRAQPSLALISVGAENNFGHPHPTTLAALAAADVPVLRTDINGDIEISIGADEMRVTD